MQRITRLSLPQPLILSAALALLLLLLAACGGEEAAPADTAVPESAATPAPAATSVPASAPDPANTPAPTSAPGPANTPETAATVAPAQAPTSAPQPTAAAAPQPAEAPAATAEAEPTATPEPTEARTATPEPTPFPPCEAHRGGAVGDCAPEFAGTQEWINSEPRSMESLRGKVVLIDFWTYSCINCLRTLPFMREWHDRYADEGLVIVGVHTPEFEFEKLFDNVVQATQTEGVAWPVVQDNEFSVWRSYSNRYWPAKYLIDQNGVIQYRHFGEGKYAETEEWIRTLLEETGASAFDPNMPLPQNAQQRDLTFNQEGGGDITRELFAGWRFTAVQGRGGIGQDEEYIDAARASNDTDDQSSVVAQFQAPGTLEPHLIYFHGPWAIGPESARHAQATPHFEDYLALMYSARSVNAVLTSESGEPYKVQVTVNGKYLTEDNRGDDVIIGDDGESYLLVTAPKLYKIVEHQTWEQRQVLRLASMSGDFGLYSFTFGVYEDGY